METNYISLPIHKQIELDFLHYVAHLQTTAKPSKLHIFIHL